jgi:predicted esterase
LRRETRADPRATRLLRAAPSYRPAHPARPLAAHFPASLDSQQGKVKTNSRYGRIVIPLVALALGLLAARLVSGAADPVRPPQRPAQMAGKLADHPSYLIYLPQGWTPKQRLPLVFGLSPGADARSVILTWSSVAEKHHWLVAASKEFRNGQEFGPSLRQIEAELNAVEREYLTDPRRVIFTGTSGGGMGSHAFSKFHTDRLSAVVINTGMMYAPFMTGNYPEGKLAVFLASPTDFRYGEMQRDRRFLEGHHWKTKWIEFAGGHVVAPATVYEQAAAWLEENLPK